MGPAIRITVFSGDITRGIDASGHRRHGPRRFEDDDLDDLGRSVSADHPRTERAERHKWNRYQHCNEWDGKRNHPTHDCPPCERGRVNLRAGIRDALVKRPSPQIA
jgi:hypothetical protein